MFFSLEQSSAHGIEPILTMQMHDKLLSIWCYLPY